MFIWELKKIIKSKNIILVVGLILLLFSQALFIYPLLGIKGDTFYKVLLSRANNGLATFIIVAIIVTLSSNLYSDEKISNIDPIILSSRNKNRVLNSKLVISIMIPIIIYLSYLIFCIVLTYIKFKAIDNGNLEAYKLFGMVGLTREVNAISYVILNIGVLTLVFLSVSVFSCLMSFISKNSIQPIVMTLIFIALGKILGLMKFLPMKFIAIANTCSFTEILSNSELIAGINIGNINLLGLNLDLNNFCILLISIGVIGLILSNIYVFKKILNK